MIKKVLFILTFFCAGFISAQSFELMDHNDVIISNTTHYEYGSDSALGTTKFHIRNLTGTQQSFALKVEKIYTPYNNSNLAVCFGVACFDADAIVDGIQIINNGDGENVDGNAIYTDLKLAPITWPWISCERDSAVWKVTVYDPANVSDEVSSTIVWRCGFPVSVNEIRKDFVSLNSFPNPASINLSINYTIDAVFNTASVDLFDMLGQKLVSTKLTGSRGQVKLNVESFNAGIYFYAIKVDGQTVKTERIVVK
jgi:hypothetical protein